MRLPLCLLAVLAVLLAACQSAPRALTSADVFKAADSTQFGPCSDTDCTGQSDVPPAVLSDRLKIAPFTQDGVTQVSMAGAWHVETMEITTGVWTVRVYQ